MEAVGGEAETRDETDAGEVDDDSDEQLEEVTRLGGDVEKYRPEEDLRSVRRMVDPRLPSVKDVKESDPLKERSVPEYSFAFDFAFPGDEFGHKTAVLVGKERMSGLVLAAAILVKGGTCWTRFWTIWRRRETLKGGSSPSRTKSLR